MSQYSFFKLRLTRKLLAIQCYR